MDRHLDRLGHQLLPEWPVVGVSLCGLAIAWTYARRGMLHVADRLVDRRVRRELEAYARLEVRLPKDGDAQGLGKRVCRLVVEVSAFERVAMLVKGAGGRLVPAADVRMEERVMDALEAWGAQVTALEGAAGRSAGSKTVAGIRAGAGSVLVVLAGMEVRLVPMWGVAGRMLGAIAVCGEGGVPPLEGLAAKLARAFENAELAERLMRSERLAGIGQMAGGVAHALNNPLTAVLGFAELIAERSDQEQVREEAATIAREAVRMQETMQHMMGMWVSVPMADEDVDLSGLVKQLGEECSGTLAQRGVGLVMELAEDVPAVRGSSVRLRMVMEHVLNHAAQAIGAAQAVALDEAKHSIRMTLRHDERGVQVIVSDTGVGFVEPMRVFESYGVGQELGLSLCYGMVREHGGEISAYNLHPRGAAVVVELPVLALDRELVAAD